MRAASFRSLSALLALLSAVPTVRAQAPPRPQLHALTNVRFAEPDDAPRSTLLLRAGSIEAILDAAAEPPIDARAIDGQGLPALPAFLDAYTHAGCITPQPAIDRDLAPKPSADVWVDMRAANRKGIQPASRVADAFQLEPELAKRYRSLGFGALLSAPQAELLAGASALASTREAAVRDLLVSPIVFDHAGFVARGPGYPSTTMGAVAQLRQFFLDARYAEDLETRYAAGRPGRRPPYDEDLSAIRPALAKSRRIVCAAETANEIERWIALADEFGFEISISGGRGASKLAGVLATRRIPVFLTLEWGEEVEDPHEAQAKGARESAAKPVAEAKQDAEAVALPEGARGRALEETAADVPTTRRLERAGDDDGSIYTEPLRVREEKRRRWEESRDTALRLAEAGVAFGFGSGKSTPRELGTLAPGKIADVIVTDGDLLDVRSRVEYVFIDGVQTSLANRQSDLYERYRDRLQRARSSQR